MMLHSHCFVLTEKIGVKFFFSMSLNNKKIGVNIFIPYTVTLGEITFVLRDENYITYIQLYNI